MSPMSSGVTGPELHRRVVLESKQDHSRLIYELSPLRIVNSTGDTITLPFKSHKIGERVSATLQNVWDYLGSEAVTLPANSVKLLVNITVELSATTTFAGKSYKIDLTAGTKTTELLEDQPGTSGLKEINVSQYAGKQVVIRPSGIVPANQSQQIIVGVGDVYVEK